MKTPSVIPLDAADPPDHLPPHSRTTVVYDAGYPAAVSAPLYHIQTQGDTIGHAQGPTGLPNPDVDIRRTVDASVGGRPGVQNRQGYTSGIQSSWRTARFTGQMVQFVTRNLALDTGPVGLSNRQGLLQAAVDAQYAVPPSMEEIYRSIVSGR